MPNPELPPYAHNLVSSLYAMKGLIETYLHHHQERLEGNGSLGKRESEEVLERAYRKADQALQIAKRLGAVLQKEKPSKVSAQASVTEAWRQVRQLIQQEFGPAAIEILDRIPENFPLLQCSPEDLKEIFYHLSRNAFQAMGKTGKLVVRAQLSFSTREEPFATIQISDTGPGIPEEKLAQVFCPFYTTKPWGEGTGLGLYLTRGLVMRNRGSVKVSSFTGSGTTFTLEFPVASQAGEVS